jgi:hypothetical protein
MGDGQQCLSTNAHQHDATVPTRIIGKERRHYTYVYV